MLLDGESRARGVRLKKVATAKFSFEELRTKGFVYVDKTDLLARLASDDDAAYFISRAVLPMRSSRRPRPSVYVFEFKYNRSATAAIRQIRDKGYADAYRAGRCPVTLVGINFSSRTRNVQEPKIESFGVTQTRRVRIIQRKTLSTKSSKRRKAK